MIPSITIKGLNYGQLVAFNNYLALSEKETNKGKSFLECSAICTIFTLHLKLNKRVMFIQNPTKSCSLKISRAEAYSILGLSESIGKQGNLDIYSKVVVKDIIGKVHKSLA